MSISRYRYRNSDRLPSHTERLGSRPDITVAEIPSKLPPQQCKQRATGDCYTIVRRTMQKLDLRAADGSCVWYTRKQFNREFDLVMVRRPECSCAECRCGRQMEAAGDVCYLCQTDRCQGRAR